MATTVAEVQVALGLSGTGTVVGGLREVDQALGQVARTGGAGGIDTDKLFGGLDKLGTGMLAAGSLGAVGFGLALKAGVDFQQSIADIGAVSGASASDLARLSSTAQQLALDTTLSGVGATDASRAMAELAKAGISVDQIIGGAARGALLLGSAGGLDFAQAATIAADAMHQFGLSGADVPHVADLFSAAAAASSIEVNDLALSLKYVGPVAHSMGMSLEETVGVIAELGNAGIKADTAGTGLRTMMVNLVNPTKAMRKVIEEYGLSFFDASGQMKHFDGIAGELHSKLGGLTDQQRMAALETLFGKESLSAAVVVYEGGAEAVRQYTAEVDKAGSAAAMGAARNNTANGALAQFKDTAEALGIALGTMALPALTDLAKKGTEVLGAFQALDPAQQELIVKAGLGATGFLLLGGSVIKTASYIRDLTGAVGDVIGAFAKKEAAKKTLTAANTVLAGSADATALSMSAVGTAASIAAPILITLALAAAGTALAMDEMNRGTTGAAKAIGGDLGSAIGTIQASTGDGLLAFLTGTAIGADKAAAATDNWAGGLGGHVRTLAELRVELQLAGDAYTKLLANGGGNTSEAATLRAVTNALFEQIVARERIADVQRRQLDSDLAGAAASSQQAQRADELRGTLTGVTTGAYAVMGATVGMTNAYLSAPPAMAATAAGLAEINTNGAQADATMNDNANAAYALAIAHQTVAPQIGYTALGMKDVSLNGSSVQEAMNSSASAAYAAATAFDAANKSLADYNKQGSQMAGYKNTLQKEFDDLIAKRDGTKLSEADAKRLADAKAQLADLNTKAGTSSFSAADAKKLADDQAKLRDLDAKSGKGPLSASQEQERKNLRAEIARLQAEQQAGGGTALSAAEQQRRKDLEAEIAALQAKAKAGTPLTAAETARLNVIAPEIDYLNAKGGENTAATNQATSNAVEALINSNNANTTANAANEAAAKAAAAVLGKPGGLPPDFTPPINAKDISGYDEFGQPIVTGGGSSTSANGVTTPAAGGPGTGGGGPDYVALLDQAVQAASVPRTINITVNGVAPKDIANEIYAELEPLLAPVGPSGVGGGPGQRY